MRFDQAGTLAREGVHSTGTASVARAKPLKLIPVKFNHVSRVAGRRAKTGGSNTGMGTYLRICRISIRKIMKGTVCTLHLR